jgi:hypothetical protein
MSAQHPHRCVPGNSASSYARGRSGPKISTADPAAGGQTERRVDEREAAGALPPGDAGGVGGGGTDLDIEGAAGPP